MMYLALFNGLVLLRFALKDAIRMRGQLYVPLLILLFLFSAFRFEVGCDWTGYLHQYRVYGAIPFSEVWNQREALWISLYTLQSSLDLPYPWINVFSSLIFFFGAHAMARRQPDSLAFLVFLFPILIINMPMSGIRQAAAIGVMFLAFNAFTDRALFRFLFFTIIAASLHSSALVFLLLAPLVNGRYSLQRLFLAAMLALPGLYLLLSSEAAEIATSRYVGTGIDAAGAIFRVGLLGMSGIYFLWFLRRHWRTEFPGDFKLAMIGALFMILMLGLLPLSSVIADRLAYYLIPVQAMMFARIPFLSLRKSRSLHVALPYLVILTVFVVWTSRSWHFNQCYMPYQSWLFGFPDIIHYSF